MRSAMSDHRRAMVDVQTALAPGVRQIDLSAKLVRRAFELGAMANMLEAIWQVMPTSKAEGVWTTHGDLALPLLTTERELAKGDVLWTDVSITYAGYCSDFGRTWVVGETRPRASRRSSSSGAHPGRGAQVSPKPVPRRRSGPGGDRRQRRQQAVAAAFLPRATASA